MSPERISTTSVVDTKIKYILFGMGVLAFAVMGSIAYWAVTV